MVPRAANGAGSAARSSPLISASIGLKTSAAPISRSTKKGGGLEFDLIAVSASLDGLTFTDVTLSETTYFAIVGDELHGSASFARSYDLQGALALAR
jgi:hypothetical protein